MADTKLNPEQAEKVRELIDLKEDFGSLEKGYGDAEQIKQLEEELGL